jgi:hypothetical protein
LVRLDELHRRALALAVHRRSRAVSARPRIDATWPVAGGYPMIDGAMVLILALAVLAVLWVIVIYGSRFFGPR